MTLDERQAKVVKYISEGDSIREAMAKVNRSEPTYFVWRNRNKGFATAVDRARARMQEEHQTRPEREWMDFAEFRARYLNRETYPHMHQWADLLAGKEPADLHPGQIFVKGSPRRLLVNTPPNHAKTQTISVDWVVYQIAHNPDVRIIIVSETQDMAKKILTAIKDRLTHSAWEELQREYAPPGGWRSRDLEWSATKIYVNGRTKGEKDPTVEVLGYTSQIYGARADLIILDDIVTLKSSRTEGRRENLIQWIDQEVQTRLEPGSGVLMIVGTRVGPNDLYRALLKRDLENGVANWTYFAQPAVLEYADDPEGWETLWPERFDGWALNDLKNSMDQITWALVYMQQQVSELMTFPEEAVMKCRVPATVGPPQEWVRPEGMQGLYVCAGLDPASAGYTAIVVLGVDRYTKMRYVLDVINERGVTPHRLRELVASLQAKYGIHEWRVEANGLQKMILQDPEIRETVFGGGAKLIEHQTYGNKWDADYGVQTLAPLFLGALSVPPKPLIVIPDNGRHKGVRAFIDQLVTWEPETRGKTDTVMALWFADLGCRQQIQQLGASQHRDSRWLTEQQREAQRTFNLARLLEERRNEKGAA
ncbi:hypothetical protein [Streptomyces hydrogenans]|uniref:hypothetical protein n=1 Tax=Streptomyces hydrogenans TaxID=1873719 RepID=UPI0035D8BE42